DIGVRLHHGKRGDEAIPAFAGLLLQHADRLRLGWAHGPRERDAGRLATRPLNDDPERYADWHHCSMPAFLRRLASSAVTCAWHGTQSIRRLSMELLPPSQCGVMWSHSQRLRRQSSEPFLRTTTKRDGLANPSP